MTERNEEKNELVEDELCYHGCNNHHHHHT